MWFWLSFADLAKPKGQRFLGVTIIEITEVDGIYSGMIPPDPNHIPGATAIEKARRLNLNPGGEVRVLPLGVELDPFLQPYANRLITSREEIEKIGTF